MRVNWEAGSTNEDNFEIDYGPSDTGPWTSLGTPTNTYVDVSSLTENTTYYFQVRAENATGYSDYLTGNETTELLLPAAPSQHDLQPCYRKLHACELGGRIDQ